MQRNLLAWWKVFGAHFKGTSRRVLSRFSWELIQTMAGMAFVSSLLLRYRVDEVQSRDGAIVVNTPIERGSWGAVSLGTVIAGDHRLSCELNNALYMHEFGHVLQSRVSGPLYLFKYGIPSVRSTRAKGAHFLHPVEQDANLRAKAYFSTQDGFKGWPQKQNTIVGEGKILTIHWWEFVPGIFPLWHLWKAGTNPTRLKKT